MTRTCKACSRPLKSGFMVVKGRMVTGLACRHPLCKLFGVQQGKEK